MENDILDSILDSGNNNDQQAAEFQITVPKTCTKCKNIQICNIISTLASMRSIGVTVEISKCKFFNQENLNENNSRVDI